MTSPRTLFGRPSLARRLVLLAAGWSLAALVVTGIVLTALFHQAALKSFDDGLNDDITNLYASISIGVSGEVMAPALTDIRATRAFSGKYWEISEPTLSGSLRMLVRSRSLWDWSEELPPPVQGVAELQAHPGVIAHYNADGPLHQPLRVASDLVRLPGRKTPVVILVAQDRRALEDDARIFAEATALALLLLGAGLVGAVFLQVRVGLQPLFALRREVAAVRKGKAEKLAGVYPTEVAPLAGELNALLVHNQEVVDRQRTHVGNLAHALKTPLSVMLAEAERHPGALASVVVPQVEAMRGQVDHHLRRARAAARMQGPGERTSVAPLLDEMAHALERIFREQAVSIDWSCPDGLAFHGERQDLQEIVGNLLENACKWSRGRVRAAAAPAPEGRLILTIEDNGPGLPTEQREEALKRGIRLDESAPGSGLGLSIVDELARAYGGHVAFSESALGGLKVAIDLPRAES